MTVGRFKSPTCHPRHGWLFSGEKACGGSVEAGAGLMKDSIASHPQRPIGLVELLRSPLATKAHMTLLERSPTSGDER
jgi:hypothetical protein